MGEFQEKLERNYRPEKQEVLSICYEDIEGGNKRWRETDIWKPNSRHIGMVHGV